MDDSASTQDRVEDEGLAYCFKKDKHGKLKLYNLLNEPEQASREMVPAVVDNHSALSYAESLLAPRRSAAKNLQRMAERRLCGVVEAVFAAAEDYAGSGWRETASTKVLSTLYMEMAQVFAAATRGHSTFNSTDDVPQTSDGSRPDRVPASYLDLDNKKSRSGGSNRLPALKAHEIAQWISKEFPGRNERRRLRAEGVGRALVCCWNQRISGKPLRWNERDVRAIRKRLAVDENVPVLRLADECTPPKATS